MCRQVGELGLDHRWDADGIWGERVGGLRDDAQFPGWDCSLSGGKLVGGGGLGEGATEEQS